MSIGLAEDQIIAAVQAHFNGRLRTVESLPADWDSDTFKRILRLTPGVFVVYGGGPLRDVGEASQNLARFALVVATTHASGELARRRGDSREIGAYEICENLVAKLHGYKLPMDSTLSAMSIENLFTGELEKQGAAIYSVTFQLPLTFDTTGGDPSTLDEFVTFNGDFDIEPADGQVDVTAAVTLEQEP